MKINRNVLAITAVGLVGYAIGHFDLVPSATTTAAPLQQDYEVSPEMQAMWEAGQPGEHHKWLEPLVGDFEAQFKIWMEPGAPPMQMPGTVHREWVLGGRYLMEKVRSESEMGVFEGLGFVGYDNLDGQYQVVWMDSMSTTIMSETGTIDPDTKMMSTRAKMRDPVSGKLMNTRGTMDLSSPDRQVFVSYMTGPDGREHKHMEGVTERK